MESKFTFAKGIDLAAFVLLVIGGLNWGAIGLFNINLVEAVFGSMSPASRFTYCLVGLAALYEIFMWRAIQRRWECRLWPTSAAQAPMPSAG
jgi:uncharacterized membrane protein YuzA (DUF378 family)